MAVIYKCDHCLRVLQEGEKRSTTIGSRSFELCPEDKAKFEQLTSDFFHIPEYKIPMGGIINRSKVDELESY